MVQSSLMSALAQLRPDTLLAILLSTAAAMALLHVWYAASKRAVLARDLAALREVESAHSPGGENEVGNKTPP